MYTERVRRLAELENSLNSDVYVLCHNMRNYSADIDDTMIEVLRRMIKFTRRRNKAALIIQTPGGDLNASYYIGEFFREYYDYTEAYVVSNCYSGGTMIALSTDNVFLSHSGCLGPIDIQRYQMPSKGNNWYPALAGQVEALIKAKEEGDISEFIERTFANKMDVLATYFREKYTYKELFGHNVKKHCVDEDKWENVWEYLSALNISHGSPLTYRKLIELGLNVKLMDESLERNIKQVICDIEHEFGDLKAKSILYDFYDEVPLSANVLNNNQSAYSKRNNSNSNPMEEHEYTVTKVAEKLAVIETPIMGFMQSHEVGITLEDMRPIFASVISSGWDEELNTSLITDEQKEDLETVLEYFASIAISDVDKDLVANNPKIYNTISAKTYESMSRMAIDEIQKSGYDIDDMTRSELYSMIVEYLTKSPDLVEFDERIEEKLRKYANSFGVNYDELGAADRIFLYDEFYGIVQELMLKLDDSLIPGFYELSEDEQVEMVTEFMFENDFDMSESNEN